MFGAVPGIADFPPKEHAARMSFQDVLKAGKWTRPAFLGSIRASRLPECDEVVYSKTLEEVRAGKAAGPFTEGEIAEQLGPEWVGARRVGIPQGGGFRCIDDFSEFLQNSTSETAVKAESSGVDVLVSMARAWGAAVEQDGSVHVSLSDGSNLVGRLAPEYGGKEGVRPVGRAIDLKAAYKNVAPDAASSRLAVVGVWNPLLRRPELFRLFALAFGARNSVFIFGYFGRALEAILVEIFQVALVEYVDDFPQIEPDRTAQSAWEVAEEVLALLGWAVNREEAKRRPFGPVFKPLGIVLDLTGFTRGRIVVRDKPERTQATLKELADMAAAGSVPAIAGSLRGKLQFAKGQAFGGSGAFGLHGLGALERGPPRPPGPFLDGLLEFWVGYFRDLVPRTVLLRDLRPPVVVAVDGAVEGDGIGLATFGAVLFDPVAGGPAQVIAEEVAEAPAAEWRAEGSKNVIMQAELLPAAVAACTWRESIRGRMVCLLVDNESARFAPIKGYSAA